MELLEFSTHVGIATLARLFIGTVPEHYVYRLWTDIKNYWW